MQVIFFLQATMRLVSPGTVRRLAQILLGRTVMQPRAEFTPLAAPWFAQ